MGLLDGKVAIVTGAGHGIGRGHALELAKHGAKVVVNDLGGSVAGEGTGRDADLTVAIIKERGGEAVGNYDDVADYEGAGRIEDVYAAIVEALVDAAGEHGEVLYAVPGSPRVAERSVDLLAKAYRKVGVSDVEVKVYEGGRHEMFNEINRDEVIADLVAWLDAHV